MTQQNNKREPNTTKEKAFLKEYSETLNATEAAMRVYNCKDRKSAKSIGCELLTKLDISKLMDMKGITSDYMLDKLKEGHEANKVISAQVINKAGDGMKTANSMTKDFIEVPDYAVRHKYLETALRLKGYGPQNDIDINIDARKQYVVNLPTRDNLEPVSKTGTGTKKA